MALRDIRFALRLLRKNPGFAAFAVATLALGTGANTAIFSAVDAILIRPLPFADGGRLVTVWEDASFIGFTRNTPAPANYVDWKSQSTVFDGMAAMRFRAFTLRGIGAPEVVAGAPCTSDLFDVLAAKPFRGRTFTAQEDSQGARVAVISYRLWQRRFGGEDTAVGRTIELNGDPHQIVGIMPREFFFPDRQRDIWTPIGIDGIRTQRGNHFLRVVGRMKQGVTIAQARTELQTIAKRLEMQYPQSNFKIGAVVEPLREDLTGSTRIALLALLGAAGFVLLIACANLANLLLARAAGRAREIAVRLAIGADRGALLTQLLTESLLLSILGGAVGAMLAAGAIKGLERMLPANIATTLSLDIRTLGFALVVSTVAGVLFGLFPAWQSARLDLHTTLKQTARTGFGKSQTLLRDFLVAGEFALAFVLLTGAGLLIQTIAHLNSVELGFNPEKILTGRIALLPAKYPNDERIRQFYAAAIEKLESIPGVQSVAFTSTLPYQSIGNTNGFEIEGRPPERDFDALYREVTPNYFAMMGAKLLAGRFYTSSDQATSEPVIIINQTFQRLYWPNGDALGKRIRYDNKEPWMKIVGVVQDLRERGAELAMKPATYPSVNQAGRPGANNLVIRTAGEPTRVAAAVRETLNALDPDVPFANVITMEALLDTNTAQRRNLMQLLIAFAALALLLAAIGVYGVLSYSVSQRTREIGLRMALGADPARVTRMVAGRGLMLSSIGLAAGLAGSLFLMQLVRSVLYGVSPNDPVILGTAAVLLVVVAIAASWAPAARASRVDPTCALRDD